MGGKIGSELDGVMNMRAFAKKDGEQGRADGAVRINPDLQDRGKSARGGPVAYASGSENAKGKENHERHKRHERRERGLKARGW